MDGRAFLNPARSMVAIAAEEYWRTAAGRAYYALLHEGLSALTRWGISRPPRSSIHDFVRQRFGFPNHADLQFVGNVLERLGRLRNEADYQLAHLGSFQKGATALSAVQRARDAIALLDQLDADPARRAAAIAAVFAAFPP
jgi:hypothetical protein